MHRHKVKSGTSVRTFHGWHDRPLTKSLVGVESTTSCRARRISATICWVLPRGRVFYQRPDKVGTGRGWWGIDHAGEEARAARDRAPGVGSVRGAPAGGP